MAEERNIAHSCDGVSFRLYDEAPEANCQQIQKELISNGLANHGLRFTKFFGRWAKNPRQKSEEDNLVLLKDVWEDKEIKKKNVNGNWVWENACGEWKKTEPILDWLDPSKQPSSRHISEKCELVVGNADQLTSACNRLKSLAAKGRHFNLDLVSRLLIGIGLPHPTENGMLFHPTLGVPYIPGSALKQVAHDWAEEEEGLSRDELDHFFGGPNHGIGCIAFLDALPCRPATLTAEQITNHYGGYYQNINPANPVDPRPDMHQPADWHEPNPVTMLAMDASFAAPQPFQFAILPLRRAGDGDIETVQNWLIRGLEIFGVGARSTVGFGRFESADAKQAREEMIKDQIRNAPLQTDDKVRLSHDYPRTKWRNREGVYRGMDEFGEHKIEWTDGGLSTIEISHIKKLTP